VSTIANILKKPHDKLEIVSFATHERYAQSLSKINANWYLLHGNPIKEWNANYAPLPPNHVLLNNNKVPANVDPDLVLCQNKASHYPTAVKIAQEYHIPLVHLEHCLPPPNFVREQFAQYHHLRCDYHIFISDHSRKAWGFDESNSVVIEHGIDSDVFCVKNLERQQCVLSCVNDWKNRDVFCGFNLWRQITGFPSPNQLPIRVSGDNPGISQPARSVAELVTIYNTSAIFLNTSLHSPIPCSLLEGAACGCAIVSTANCLIPSVFTHEQDALLSNDPAELRGYCQRLLNEPEFAREMGLRARETVVKRFNLDRFVQDWKQVLEKVI
jgi:glycosyltransferase involved in cell wall biosynthesis